MALSLLVKYGIIKNTITYSTEQIALGLQGLNQEYLLIFRNSVFWLHCTNLVNVLDLPCGQIFLFVLRCLDLPSVTYTRFLFRTNNIFSIQQYRRPLGLHLSVGLFQRTPPCDRIDIITLSFSQRRFIS